MNRLPNATAPTVQLLAWLGENPRSYTESIEVWKTTCPQLAVWEDALSDDLVRIDRGCVRLTPAGRELLDDSVIRVSGSVDSARGHCHRPGSAPATTEIQ